MRMVSGDNLLTSITQQHLFPLDRFKETLWGSHRDIEVASYRFTIFALQVRQLPLHIDSQQSFTRRIHKAVGKHG
jgi:hypothetical protein